MQKIPYVLINCKIFSRIGVMGVISVIGVIGKQKEFVYFQDKLFLFGIV